MQSVAGSPLDLGITVGHGVAAVRRTTYLGDDLGALEVRGDGITVPLAPFETVGVRITRAPGSAGAPA
ncbi:hypothetical protein P9139_06065 [Curtobacterium flaccumfaciens]|nr:hypothetical protein P9139_06065 [Curtobacterium flaccumfaciens]